MRCNAARQALAVYRELGDAERRRVDAHMAQCAACAEAFAAYRRQDKALAALPPLEPRSAWVSEVRYRTVARPAAAAASLRRWVPVTALALLLFLSGSLGTIEATNQALPGDWLYPVKRTVEQVRLSFIRSEAPRSAYLEQVRSTRIEEAREIVAIGREALVEFEAPYVGRDGFWWTVDGLQVLVPPEVWPGEAPPQGSALRIRAQATDGTLKASAIDVSVQPKAAPSAEIAEERPPDPGRDPTETPANAGAVSDSHADGEPAPGDEPPANAADPAPSEEPPTAPDPEVTPDPAPDSPGRSNAAERRDSDNGRRPHSLQTDESSEGADDPQPLPPAEPPEGGGETPMLDEEPTVPPSERRGPPDGRIPPGQRDRARPSDPESGDTAPPQAAAEPSPEEAPDEPGNGAPHPGNRPDEPPGQAVAEERREESGRPENPGADRGH